MINFEKAFEGYNVPERIRKASESICKKFNINGICDPMYICNVIAFESGSGDGCSNFTSDKISNNLKLAEKLQFSFGCNIPKDKIDEIVKVLEV